MVFLLCAHLSVLSSPSLFCGTLFARFSVPFLRCVSVLARVGVLRSLVFFLRQLRQPKKRCGGFGLRFQFLFSTPEISKGARDRTPNFCADGWEWVVGWERQRQREMGRTRSGMSSSWFETAPPQIITVERSSQKQRTLDTILEKVAAMGLWLETAPPQIITVERCSPRPASTLDTIAEESMTLAAGQFASEAAAAAAADVLRPINLNWEKRTTAANSRLTPGYVACNWRPTTIWRCSKQRKLQ